MESILPSVASDEMQNAKCEMQNPLPQEEKLGFSVGRRGFRRLAKMEGFLQNLESVTNLHDNVASGKLYLIHRMLKTGKLDVNTLNEDGDTALSVAINCGQKEAFRLLLKHGANPNIRSPPKERSFGICENSPLWKTIKFRDLEWCQLLMEAGYCTVKDEEKGGWIEALRGHLKDIEKRKSEEGVDLSQDPFNLTYTNFFQWYDDYNCHEPSSLVKSCRRSIRDHLLQTLDGGSIYAAIDEGLEGEIPSILLNYLLMQDGFEGGKWLDNYKKAARAFEKMFIFVDECVEADKEGGEGSGIDIEGALGGLNVSHG